MPALKIDVVNRFIERFRAMVELEWRNPIARRFGVEEMPADRVQSNLLLDPDQWSNVEAASASR